MMTVAGILKGHKVSKTSSLGIAPGSRQVLQMLCDKNAVKDMLDAGARILESACGFCIGNHFSPKSHGVSLRTSNRNFEARSGTKDAQVYLVSPEVAAVAAITGKITDPRKAGIRYPQIKEPLRFLIDDTMFIMPKETKNKEEVVVFRGPNIGEPPRNTAMPEKLNGTVMIHVGDKITTDHIMPAGARLKFRSNVPEYSKFVFEPCDPSFHDRCLANKAEGLVNVIVAGESYGQGSSREHAALCPMYLGVKAVIAKSIERIHRANLINFGIVPLVFEDPDDYGTVVQGDMVSLKGLRTAVEGDGRLKIHTAGGDICVRADLSSREKELLLAGGLLASIAASASIEQ